MRNPDPNFDRLKQTLNCQKTDRVPLAEIYIDEEVKSLFIGKPVYDLSSDIEFYTNAGYDYISLGRRIAGFPGVWEAAKWLNYYEVQRHLAHGGSKGIINDWKDFKTYPWIKANDLDFRILDEAEKILPSGMKVIRYMGPIFQMTWMLMGFESFCFNLVDNRPLVDAVVDKISEIVFYELQDALERGIIGAIWYADDIAIKDRLMVSPQFLKESFFPKLRVLGEGCKRRGIPLIYHTDGDVNQVIEDIIDSGVNALHPIDPTGMDIYEVKKKLAGKLAVIGNIDVDLLLRGTLDDVISDTKKHLELLSSGGGYALGSSNSIPRAVNLDNYKAMIDTTLRYGEPSVDQASEI